MHIVTRIEGLDAFAGGAFVPTMGALHAGHEALLRAAAATGRHVVASIFVNPTQFAAGEDFARYPRTFESDCALAERAGAAAVFAPADETIYPPGGSSDAPTLPPVAIEPGLEDRLRPGHFAGVCQVVARLFDLVRPACAIFGEKDFQQLLVVSAMARIENERAGRWPGLTIMPHPTVREPDGLAMSSRNRSLKPESRDSALGLFRALSRARGNTAAGHSVRAIEERMHDMLSAHGLVVDYAVVRDAATLQPIESVRADAPARALIAARLGQVRLIDNVAMGITPPA